MTKDETVGWHHQLNGHEFEQIVGMVKDREARQAGFLVVTKRRTQQSNCKATQFYFQSSPKSLLGDKYFTCHFSKQRMLQKKAIFHCSPHKTVCPEGNSRRGKQNGVLRELRCLS